MPDLAEQYADALSERVAELQGQRAALLAAIEETRTARSLMFADDEHDPDGSTASLDQARDVALLHRVEQTLAELAAARHRLETGVLDRCAACGGPIPAERLLARPESTLCVTCAAATSRRQRRID